jgi:phosphatidylglycerol:prolipoprotein diacylglycerol transferase
VLSLLAETSQHIRFEDLGLSAELFSFELGSLTIALRWYSLAYIAGIVLAWWHLTRMIKAPGAPMGQRHTEDLFFYCTLGVILGGRLGYAIFYQPELFYTFQGDSFISYKLLRLWDGGMSFHGGVLGVLAAIAWVSRRGELSFLRVCDYIAVNVPFGMLFGRLANFVNGELWGRETDVAWAIIFPAAGPYPRHPSQLYEALLEGLVLAIVLMVLFWKTRARFRPGLLVGTFTAGIGIGRFIVEFYRQPDAQLTEFAAQTGLSMGQWLSIPLILVGFGFAIRALLKPPLASGKAA